MTEFVEAPTNALDDLTEGNVPSPGCRSHLVLDLGASNTVVTLYDIVEGQYRFISRGSSLTTTGAPWFDVNHGFRAAANQITESTGRIIINSKGYLICPSRLDGTGIDCFGMVVSAADPLRTVLIGLMEDLSLASARKALRTIYGIEVDRFSLSDDRSENSRLESLLRKNVDLAVIVGGSDGGADDRLMEQVDTLSIGLHLLDDFQRPRVIYAGNIDFSEQVAAELSEVSDVFTAENLRPTVDDEELDGIIGLLASSYTRQKINELPGIEGIKDLSSLPILPTAHAFGGITEYLAALYDGKVVGLDIGSGSVSLVVSDPDNVDLIVRSDLGLGAPIVNVLKDMGLTDIFGWTDGHTRADEVRDFIFNKSLMAQTVPQNTKELILEQAIAGLLTKEVATGLTAGQHLTENGILESIKLLVLRGGILSKSPSPGYPLLAVIDGLQPTGVFKVVLDSYDTLPAMGLLATHNPQLVVQVLDSGVLTDIGWVVVASGQADLGSAVLRLSLEIEGVAPIRREIKFGKLELIPLAAGKVADLILQPASGFDVGAGRGKRITRRINGSKLGLLIDARGRPISIKGDEVTRRSHQQQWLKTISS
jgi:hypothetical protein